MAHDPSQLYTLAEVKEHYDTLRERFLDRQTKAGAKPFMAFIQAEYNHQTTGVLTHNLFGDVFNMEPLADLHADTYQEILRTLEIPQDAASTDDGLVTEIIRCLVNGLISEDPQRVGLTLAVVNHKFPQAIALVGKITLHSPSDVTVNSVMYETGDELPTAYLPFQGN